ncbi:hypothetical protein [Aurantiacibacter luteus]|nr:hypothetical protein [Aurantiacibacter luteus]
MTVSEPIAKATWQTPVLVELDRETSDIENGYAFGTDGNGGFSTSMS